MKTAEIEAIIADGQFKLFAFNVKTHKCTWAALSGLEGNRAEGIFRVDPQEGESLDDFRLCFGFQEAGSDQVRLRDIPGEWNAIYS